MLDIISFIEAFNLIPSVSGHMHERVHTLDLVLSNGFEFDNLQISSTCVIYELFGLRLTGKDKRHLLSVYELCADSVCALMLKYKCYFPLSFLKFIYIFCQFLFFLTCGCTLACLNG